MSETPGVRQRAAARDALTARMRRLTGAAIAVSAALSGVFAGMAAASAPGHKLHPGTTTQAAKKQARHSAAVHTSTAIPPLPPPPGPGNDQGAPPAPSAAPAPAPAQSAPVVVSGGS